MALLYMMSLEDRVDLARNQLNVVILKLRQAVKEQGQLDAVEQVMYSATAQLQDISELIGR